jgi:hypothetical protein
MGTTKLRKPRLGIASWRALPVTVLFLCHAGQSIVAVSGGTGVLLPDGTELVSWEQPLQFTKTYYVTTRIRVRRTQTLGRKNGRFRRSTRRPRYFSRASG